MGEVRRACLLGNLFSSLSPPGKQGPETSGSTLEKRFSRGLRFAVALTVEALFPPCSSSFLALALPPGICE